MAESSSIVMGAILHSEPPPLAPAGLDRLVRRCLSKDPDERWQSAHDVKVALESLSTPEEQPVAAGPRRREWIAWGVAAALLVALLALAIPHRRETPTAPPTARFLVYPPEGTVFSGPFATVPATQLAISPDGRRLAFVAGRRDAPRQLWLRSLDDPVARPLAGTEEASYPFWSPDSNELGFFGQGKLKKVNAAGGPPQVLCDVNINAFGGTWNADGVILFGPSNFTGLSRVPAGGGTPTPATTLDHSKREGGHVFPQFLPDGEHFLHFRRASPEHRGIYVGSLDGKTNKLVLPVASSPTAAAWAPPGHLLFVDGTTLVAQRFDLDKLEFTGQRITVAQPVRVASTNYAAFSVSRTGVLAYDSGAASSGRLSWYDRSGRSLGSLDPPADYTDFRLSPDETRVAATRVDPQTNQTDIWILDLSRGTNSRFTTAPLLEATPNWSPDGGRILFRSNNNGPWELITKPSGGGQEELIAVELQVSPVSSVAGANTPSDWSADGRFVVFSSASFDLWALPMFGDRKPVPLAQSEFVEAHGNLSPDSRWLAYTSNETGRYEVYVQPFLGADGAPRGGPSTGKQQVSTRGGYEPRWRGDGKELYYISAERKLMAVSVSGGASFQAGIPQALFPLRILSELNPFRFHYVPARDGRRFLVNTLQAEVTPSPITVVLNWSPAAARP